MKVYGIRVETDVRENRGYMGLDQKLVGPNKIYPKEWVIDCDFHALRNFRKTMHGPNCMDPCVEA